MPGTFDKQKRLDVEALMVENEVNKYFAQSVAWYFGEDAFSVRMQAYDDMLWVVLGWLESIQFISSHSEQHYPSTLSGDEEEEREPEWHGKQFIPAFAHRARIFYELASEGWDWRLCGGGMVWSPHLLPYKNAITNELFIAASTSMYLYFPGDDNSSPFLGAQYAGLPKPDASQSVENDGGPTYNPIYLANAVNGYDWLKSSGMTNSLGLYVDGFHIKDYTRNKSKTECDERNEMVYTYNQGVILSGLRGLWEGTGKVSYLEDGHELIRNVIHATGWTDTDLDSASFSLLSNSNQKQSTSPPPLKKKAKDHHRETLHDWSGLGSHGILTEACDPFGTCSQDSHTFKGIFFHHLTAFCAPLPTFPVTPGKTHAASKLVARLHRKSCNEYAPWVMHNGNAALKTKDRKGRFGGWWGASLLDDGDSSPKNWRRKAGVAESILPKGAVDYRNSPDGVVGDVDREGNTKFRAMPVHTNGDLNDRGRGRTVETQGGGVAVTRAMWEFLKNYESDT